MPNLKHDHAQGGMQGMGGMQGNMQGNMQGGQGMGGMQGNMNMQGGGMGMGAGGPGMGGATAVPMLGNNMVNTSAVVPAVVPTANVTKAPAPSSQSSLEGKNAKMAKRVQNLNMPEGYAEQLLAGLKG
jgi:hypothetical protein